MINFQSNFSNETSMPKIKKLSPIGVLSSKIKLNSAKNVLKNNPDTFNDVVDISGRKRIINKNKTFTSTIRNRKNLIEYSKQTKKVIQKQSKTHQMEQSLLQNTKITAIN